MQGVTIVYKESEEQLFTYYINQKETVAELKERIAVDLETIVESLSLSYRLSDGTLVISHLLLVRIT